MNLPIYQCHKMVGAAKIVCVGDASTSGVRSLGLDLLNGLTDTVLVDDAWMQRNPKTAVGGYYVVYVENADQYSAYSPAEPFESGYSRLNLADKSFDFGIALCHLKTGKRVARRGWNGKGLWLDLQTPDAYSKMTLPYVFMCCPEDAQNTPGARVPWLASQTDMLANDWTLAE